MVAGGRMGGEISSAAVQVGISARDGGIAWRRRAEQAPGVWAGGDEGEDGRGGFEQPRLERCTRRIRSVADRGGEQRRLISEHGKKQVLLAREVLVEDGCRDASRGGDLGHRGIAVAIAG